MKKILYTLLMIAFIFSSCQKEEGCTDAMATNYNIDAEEDDGAKWNDDCFYDGISYNR